MVSFMQDKRVLEIIGSIENIIYRNESNGYTVLEILTNDELITAVGIMGIINVGENVKLFGNWKNHPSFGTQFNVDAYEITMPSTQQSIFKYLCSGAIRGIGKTIAERLVQQFGDNTLQIMRDEPNRLLSIRGITKDKAKKISESLHNIFGIREIMIYMNKYNISSQEALRIWKTWGSRSIDVINENPYLICEEPICINFEIADSIALLNGFSTDNVDRIRSAIIYVLNHNMKNGHTCLPVNKLAAAVANFLEIDVECVLNVLEYLVDNQILTKHIMQDVEFIFIPKMYEIEVYSASRLLMMLNYPPSSVKGIENEISLIEKNEGIEYAYLQKKAIKDALEKGLLVLTGGPGTGKTTTLNAIIKILNKRGQKVLLAAPTGRAAKRMSELTGEEAKTIHRLLEFNWNSENNMSFKKNEKNLLECDALILDELSMVDAYLFESLLKALPLGCRLIMVGDTDQLPSVGAGNVLMDIINSEVIPVVKLTEIFRQSMRSLIVTNAHKIVKGKPPELFAKDNDFFFIDRFDTELARKTVIDLYSRRLPNTYQYSPLFDIQVLCPSRKGDLGTAFLNQHLQESLNPASIQKKEISFVNGILRQGDKVMQTRNNYNVPWYHKDGSLGEGVFNGDIGILVDIDKSKSRVKVQYDDRIAVYEMDNLSDLELAYAVTIHKSQGSEFECIIIPMLNVPPKLCYRNLLYTGVTRAKSMVVMVGSKSVVYKMVENNRKTKRYSGLLNFLVG